MITAKKDIALLSEQDQKKLLFNVSGNPKHTLMILLMLDCGLRVTEMTSLRVGNFDFTYQSLSVKSLKKRSDKPIYREIPLTSRVIESLSEVYIRLPDKSDQAFLFPTDSISGHINRKRVWKMMKKYSSWTASPHMLRHTFATKIVQEGADIRIAQDLLGHKSAKTTEIYLHIAEQEKQTAIDSIDKKPLAKRLKDRFFPKKNVFILNPTNHFNDIHIGSKKEIQEITELSHKRINLILLGPQGVGKSQLLKMLNTDKVLRLDDFKSVKSTLGNILLELNGVDKEKIIELLTKIAEIEKVITKNSVLNLIKLLISSTNRNEYTLIIDDLTALTPSCVTALDNLKNHFHIIAASRKIKMSHGSFLSNFQKINTKPLNRIESTELIMKLNKIL